jgi:hypothetical protein
MLDARCRKTSWHINQVELVNISEGGCCISGRTDGLAVGDEVSLRIVGLRSIPGNVRWVEKRQAGISFAKLLEDDVVGNLVSTYTVGEAKPAGYRDVLKAG